MDITDETRAALRENRAINLDAALLAKRRESPEFRRRERLAAESPPRRPLRITSTGATGPCLVAWPDEGACGKTGPLYQVCFVGASPPLCQVCAERYWTTHLDAALDAAEAEQGHALTNEEGASVLVEAFALSRAQAARAVRAWRGRRNES
jgi:hypothetical protein